MEHLPVSGPWITDGEAEYVQDAARNAWYSKADMYHKRFAEAFAEYLDVQYKVPLPSCTSAIHLSLTALDIGPSDEVVLPDITWIASSAPVSYVGATPVFADIEPDTWCLSAESLEKNISEKTERPEKTNKTSYEISPYGVNLPSGMNMTLEKTWQVCEALQEVLAFQS
jgi:perosamine synthetase